MLEVDQASGYTHLLEADSSHDIRIQICSWTLPSPLISLPVHYLNYLKLARGKLSNNKLKRKLRFQYTAPRSNLNFYNSIAADIL